MPARSQQLTLPLRPKRSHGGSRPGAGRRRTSKFQPHVARKRFSAREPLHVTLRLRECTPSLYGNKTFRCLSHAVKKARRRGLAVIHFAVLSNHVHLILEARDQRALARQMQSLCISFAKKLNAIRGVAGAVFRERYHVHVLRTPREARNALRYVLMNEQRHRGGKGRVLRDYFSSAVAVGEPTWRRLLGAAWRKLIAPPEETGRFARDRVVARVFEWTTDPRSWLLRVGWMRA